MDLEWKVEKICDKQLRDVNPNDLVEDGLYRLCDVYKSGGGYDKLPNIIASRFNYNIDDYRKQFVVQLKGCVMKCPYCYVTPDGINATPVLKTTDELVESFIKTGVNVFHLMGGSPAIYIKDWNILINKLLEKKPQTIFHSDLLLQECNYTKEVIESISKPNSVYAISIKGANKDEYLKNTGVPLKEDMLINNLDVIKNSSLNYYFTFTGMTEDGVKEFCDNYNITSKMLKDSFIIKLIDYDALK